MLDKAKRLEVESNDRIVKLQKSLNDETALRISLENTSREVDSRHRRAINDIRAEKEDEIKELEQAIGQLKSEISSYSLKLKEGAIKSDGDGNANAVKMKDTLSTNGSLTVKSPNFVTGIDFLYLSSVCDIFQFKLQGMRIHLPFQKEAISKFHSEMKKSII